jgi:hypothetical protein
LYITIFLLLILVPGPSVFLHGPLSEVEGEELIRKAGFRLTQE